MFNRLFSVLRSYSGLSVDAFAEVVRLTPERIAELESCNTVESRIVAFDEVLRYARHARMRMGDMFFLNHSLRFPTYQPTENPGAQPLACQILNDYSAAYNQQLSEKIFTQEATTETPFVERLPAGHSLRCDTPQILYLDDTRDPRSTISDEQIARSSVLLVKDLRGFHKAIAEGFHPDEVHFDGYLADGERGIHAVEELAEAIVDGRISPEVTVYFHSADPDENKKMRNLFFSTLSDAGIDHYQKPKPKIQVQIKKGQSLSPLRAQIARQKNKGRR